MSQDNRTIMIVDDDKRMLNACERLLSKNGYRCRTFTSPFKALEKFDEIRPAVVLSDQYMQRMFGTVFLARIKKMQPKSVGIIMTGHGDTASVLSDLAKGEIFAVIRKPWKIKTFESTIKLAFDHHKILRESES